MKQQLHAPDKRLLHSLLIVFVFISALLPRLGEGASRPNVWYERSYLFSFAVLEGDWLGTFQRYHPGVTFMWLASLGIQPYLQRNGFLTEEQVLVHEPVAEDAINGLVAAALLPVALAIAGGITLAFVWLKALIGNKMALAAAWLIAFDPLHLANSKVAHLDGLLAVLMLLAAVAIVRYVRGHGRIYLLLSGGLAGLSLLTKTSAVFLIPYTALILGWPVVWSGWQSWRTSRRLAVGRQAAKAVANYLIWLIMAGVVIFVLFPALWVEPDYVLSEMVGNLTRHATNVHKNPVFFNGQIWVENDPGFPFYAAIMAYKMTAVTMIFMVVGLVMSWQRPFRQNAPVLWALAAFALFFFTQMSIGDFKQMSYILPALPAIEVMAGIGLVWSVEWAAERFQWPATVAAPGGLAGFLLLHAALVLPTYPLFGTYHNQLLGGAKAASQAIPIQEQAEGIDAALDFIKNLDYSDKATIAISSRMTSFAQRWHNVCYRTEEPTSTAFRIYDINSLMRNNLNEVWLAQWELDQQTVPLFQATYDGLTYAWVYGEMPAVPAITGAVLPTRYQFGDAIRLESAAVSDDLFQAGDSLEVRLVWTADDWICDDYKVFVHVYAADGSLVAQQDVLPLNGARPTWTWKPGNSFEDVVTVILPPALEAGSYQVAVGMYDAATLARLPAFDGTGARVVGDTAVLTEITVAR